MGFGGLWDFKVTLYYNRLLQVAVGHCRYPEVIIRSIQTDPTSPSIFIVFSMGFLWFLMRALCELWAYGS